MLSFWLSFPLVLLGTNREKSGFRSLSVPVIVTSKEVLLFGVVPCIVARFRIRICGN